MSQFIQIYLKPKVNIMFVCVDHFAQLITCCICYCLLISGKLYIYIYIYWLC